MGDSWIEDLYNKWKAPERRGIVLRILNWISLAVMAIGLLWIIRWWLDRSG